MKYLSTRDHDKLQAATLSEAILRGAAPDGGLYLPEIVPRLPLMPDGEAELARTAKYGLDGYFEDDPLQESLDEIVRESLNFPIPLSYLDQNLHVLELFHGPTAAFKDVGARFLAACMQRIAAQDERRTVLVATSGDTGGAVASAFFKRPGFDVVILFPEGRVSPLQAHQLSCWGANVRTFAVQGSFDDCQRLVKEAFANRDLCQSLGLTSANSINIGRLLPQIVYYLHAARLLGQTPGEAPGFIVPSGNLGNVTACVLAKLMGARIGPVILACNANRTVPDFFASGVWTPHASVATLATAMDVGDPSNMERLRALFDNVDSLRGALRAVAVSDDEIRAAIQLAKSDWGVTWCPHTATGLHAFAELDATQKRSRPWVVVATAHAAKFAEVVEPLTGVAVAMPPALAALLDRPAQVETLAAEIDAFTAALKI